MKKMKKFLTLAMTVTLLFSSMTVNAAASSITAKQNADYMMSTNKDGAPNWFNGTYYSDRYEDLKIAFNTNEKALYNHSLQYGFNESRLVTPVLDVAKYRAFYPDLDKAFGNNWKLYVRHYFEYGINEGRYNFTDFNAKTYLSMYDDLQIAFGNDLGLATRHYIEYGISEGRAYNWPEPEIGLVYDISDNDNDDDNNSSDSGSSDDDNTEQGFTGDKRVEHEGGSYVIETYVNGILTYDEFYDEDGIQKSRTLYRADGTKSSYREYDEQGNETLYIEYQADGTTENLKRTYTYDENGAVTSEKYTWANGSTAEVKYKNGVRTYQVDISTDGTKMESEYYTDGRTTKIETTYATDGTKTVVELWENSNLKSWTWYDASGNMTRKQLYDKEGTITSDTDYTIATPSNATPTE